MKHTCWKILTVQIFFFIITVIPAVSEPLQNDLFVLLKPDGFLGNAFTHATLKVADSSDDTSSAIYDFLKNNSKLQKVFEMYRDSQTEGNPDKKALPLNIVIKEKGNLLMDSFSAYITTYNDDGKLSTDYQYVCPKVVVPLSSEMFAVDPKKLSDPSHIEEFICGVAHETAHAIMKRTYGYIPKGINPFAAFGHEKGKASTNELAFTEGYAEFMGAYFSGDSLDDPSSYQRDIGANMAFIPKTRKENQKTEGVVASIFWDMAKLPDGFNKIHRVLKEKRPWKIESMAKFFKELYPEDATAIDAIMDENLNTAPDPLLTCWLEIRTLRSQIDSFEKQLASTWNPVSDAKAFVELQKAKTRYKNLMDRYLNIYGFTEEQLTSSIRPAFKNNSTAVNVISSGTSPFSE
ncbi:MAG: hypothetical protein HQM10_18960 [Candidatus Riflebacteria bacterium]|nr:hypothetical protein [Candidatus Riflebacteria bacterium]